MFFEITHKEKNSRARTGIMHTDHGDIETPIFMPVGTQGTVKSLDFVDLKNLEAQIILGNTYHLHLRPGEDVIAKFGGLHKFMNWDKPILTDSGGFQVFSLGAQKTRKQPARNPDSSGGGENTESTKTQKQDESKSSEAIEPACPAGRQLEQFEHSTKLVSIDEDGVTFRSHIDGSKHRFTPESAIETQHKIGADIIMAFDECTPDDADTNYTRQAMERTHRWAERCIVEHQKNTKARKHENTYRQFLFGIIQGANHKELREESAKAISALDFDGIAIGGESVGYNMEATKNILDWVIPLVPEEKPHYAMGLGFSPMDLFEVVERGVDMFDCVSPTRMARNGTLFVHPKTLKKNNYRISITNAEFREDPTPIDPLCECFTCKNHSRAYLHHLFKSEELLAYRLATLHNLHFFLNLMKEIRAAIREDRFLELKQEWTM